MLASAANPVVATATPATMFSDRSPCSKLRTIGVSDRPAIHSSRPGRPASVKSSTQEPTVKASVTMAAVALLSVIDAANSAMAPISIP